jgi:hypothetical protein|tara:strand:+ start:138 stop:767 length:630 start_codon:yes stop_codon:yes gene_type:complete
MAITYPLALPTVTGVQSIDLRTINSVAYSRSPFTFSGQAQASAGQMWGATVTLPPMRRAQAAVWVSWLTSLRGQFGTFLMGDPTCGVPLGTAASNAGSPVVNGGSQTGEDLIIDGVPANKTGYLKAGDYIQLGTGATATLHQVLQDVNSGSGGGATITLWPHIRTAPLNNSTVVVANAVGRWRLSGNESNWNIDQVSIFGITFSAMEDV